MNALTRICAYLGLEFQPRFLSQMDVALPPITHAGQWAAEISHALDAEVYINAPGGRGIFRQEEFDAYGIELKFLKPDPFHYATSGYDFVENLSIIDVLMWNSPEAVRERLGRAVAEFL